MLRGSFGCLASIIFCAIIATGYSLVSQSQELFANEDDDERDCVPFETLVNFCLAEVLLCARKRYFSLSRSLVAAQL